MVKALGVSSQGYQEAVKVFGLITVALHTYRGVFTEHTLYARHSDKTLYVHSHIS